MLEDCRMKRLVFQGYSDDTFACEGPGIDVDRDTCASGEAVYMRVWCGDADCLIVSGQYCPGDTGGWLIGVSPARGADEQHIPLWPIRIERGEREYSPLLVIEAPDDVHVELLT
jgi:hypothetical protein